MKEEYKLTDYNQNCSYATNANLLLVIYSCDNLFIDFQQYIMYDYRELFTVNSCF